MLEINKKNIRVWSMLGMRRIVGIAMKDLADRDESFLFTTADLGRYFGISELQQAHPNQVVDLGIAEQNLIGASAGLQSEGFRVFAATYATFITARVLDQVRVNLGLMGLGVKLIGAAGGLSDGNFSATHMAVEDIADMRAIPNLTVITPADGLELVKAIDALSRLDGPAYLRLTGRANIPVIYKEDYPFEIGKAVVLREGADVAILSNGTILGSVLAAAEDLEQEGIRCTVVDLHTVKPLDTDMLDRLASHKLVVTVEEHMKAGGLGSAVAEYYAEGRQRPAQLMIAMNDFYPDAREYEDLLEVCGLTREGVRRQITEKYQMLF